MSKSGLRGDCAVCVYGRRPCATGVLAALCLAALLSPVRVCGQAAEYATEEVELREADGGEGLPGGAADVAPPQIPGASSIGSARTSVRGGGSGGQSAMLRYDQHREIQPPEYATLRLGPLYSNVGISQSAGYRYTRLSGAGVDYLEGNRRGDIKEGGSEFPLVSGVTLDNYMIITRKMDLEANVSINYYHYPMKTQEDELDVNLTDEGIFATFSSQFDSSRNSKILVYDDILYRTDYVDTRGLEDRYGGREFENLQNTAGLDWDWQPTPLDSVSAGASRRDTIPFDEEFDRQEGVTYSEMTSYRRSLTPYLAAGLLGSASQSFYTDEERPDASIYGISAFTGVRLSRRVTGDASLGYQFYNTTGGLLDEDASNSTMSGSLGLNHEISETRRQRLSYARSLAESFEGGVDIADTIGYNLSWSSGLFPGGLSSTYALFEPQDEDRAGYGDWTTSLTLQHQLTRLMNLSLGASYAIRMNDASSEPEVAGDDAEEDTGDALPDLTSDYETLTLTASTGFQVTRKTMLSLYASHADRTSDSNDLVYTRDTIGATLTWSHKF